MELELEVFGSLCETKTFKINGVCASYEDFGEKYDRGSSSEPYACANMQFTRVRPTQDVLDKYGITKAEYHEICDKLEEDLSFGCCGWCV